MNVHYDLPTYSKEIEVIEWVQCNVDEVYYCKSHCVFDKDGVNYIHRSNLATYLKNFEADMLQSDYEILKTNLLKQL